MSETRRMVGRICMYYEANGECHALPYEPEEGFVPDPSLVEYGTGGENFAVSRDAWCKARHGASDWKEKRITAELETAQKPCSRYKKGWPRTEDNLVIFDEYGQWVRDVDKMQRDKSYFVDPFDQRVA